MTEAQQPLSAACFKASYRLMTKPEIEKRIAELFGWVSRWMKKPSRYQLIAVAVSRFKRR